MIGFGIDEVQAEYVAEIKLRHINREYILKRTEEIDQLKSDIEDMEETLESPRKIKKLIIDELTEIADKYGQPRRTLFAQAFDDEEEEEEQIPDYTVNCFLTAEGYFKRITAQSLRMSGEQKLKEGDEVIFEQELSGKTDLLFITDKYQVYKSCVNDFADTKASLMGDYIPAKLEMEPNEKIVKMIATEDYSEQIVLFFKNGKCAKVPLSSFETKTKRKKLANAYFDGSELVSIHKISEECDFILQSAAGKIMIFNTALVLPKAARDTMGVQVMRLTKTELQSAMPYVEGMLDDADSYLTKTVPVAGTASKLDINQITFE